MTLPSLGPLGRLAEAAPHWPQEALGLSPLVCFWEMCLGASAHPAPHDDRLIALGLALGVL